MIKYGSHTQTRRGFYVKGTLKTCDIFSKMLLIDVTTDDDLTV